MWCIRCDHDLSDCHCPDLQERLSAIGGAGGPLIYRACVLCKKHYAKCACAEPIWTTSDKLFE